MVRRANITALPRLILTTLAALGSYSVCQNPLDVHVLLDTVALTVQKVMSFLK